MKFERVDVNLLIPADYNPRKDLKPTDKEYMKIKKSIEEFGYVEPIIVNKDNTIIGGHQRLKVLKDLGYTEVDVVKVEVDKTKEKALNIALNKITGEFDIDTLTDLMKDLHLANFDLEITGFDLDEIDEMLNEDEEVEEDDFELVFEEEKKLN